MLRATSINPAQISSNQQLGHFRVMRVFHGNRAGLESVVLGELGNLLRVVVAHEKIPFA